MSRVFDKIKSPQHLRQQLGGLVFLFLIFYTAPVGISFDGAWIFLLGSLIYLAGIAGRIWASGFLVKNDSLTTTGPYGRVRNPIYVSNLLMGAGLVILSVDYWTFLILILLYVFCYAPGMRTEEENLRRRFGESFESYARSVPLIVPRLRTVSGYGGDAWSLGAYRANRETFVTLGLLIGYGIVIWKRLGHP